MTQHEIEQLKKKYASDRELDKAINILADLILLIYGKKKAVK